MGRSGRARDAVITELRVRDLATIADVTLSLGSGLNVLTGETGAGKSMLVDALGLLLGGRADSGAIRPGAARAIVEGVFESVPAGVRHRAEALGLDAADDRLVVRREIAPEGRSRAWVNGSPTTVAILDELGGSLVDLHGQHQTRSLAQAETQRDLLDAFAEAEAERGAVAAAAGELEAVRGAEAALAARRDEVRRRADYLRHVVQEIDAARLRPGEEDELDREARRLAHADQLSAAAALLAESLDGEAASAVAALGTAERALGQLERTDPTVAAWRELLDGAYAGVGELARLAREYAAGLEGDPARLDEVERRRDLVSRLRQKYGDTIAAVLDAGAKAAAELDLLDTADLDLQTLAARRVALEQALAAAAAALTARRLDGGGRLGRAVNRLLPKLGLPKGRLSVGLSALPAPGQTGAEAVVFTVQLNPGLDERPLAKTASGGELSRLMLALKVVLTRQDRVPVLVFDELDQGIGGEAGGQVADALVDVAARHQVLVITHLPQIAARADRHLVVSKRPKGGIATSDVALIHGEDRVSELARMLGDADGEAARRHALAMLTAGRS